MVVLTRKVSANKLSQAVRAFAGRAIAPSILIVVSRKVLVRYVTDAVRPAAGSHRRLLKAKGIAKVAFEICAKISSRIPAVITVSQRWVLPRRSASMRLRRAPLRCVYVYGAEECMAKSCVQPAGKLIGTAGVFGAKIAMLEEISNEDVIVHTVFRRLMSCRNKMTIKCDAFFAFLQTALTFVLVSLRSMSVVAL